MKPRFVTTDISNCEQEEPSNNEDPVQESKYLANIRIVNNELTFKFSWLDIMFIPFQYSVNWIFMTINILSIHMYLYIMCFDDMEGYRYLMIGKIILEFFYFFRTMMLVLHRVMTVHRQKRTYKPTSLVLIFLDFFSLIPVTSCYGFMDRFTWINLSAGKYAVRINCALKLTRVVQLVVYYKDLRAVPVFNQTMIVILFHFSVTTICAHISAFIYCSMTACYRCKIKDWTNNLESFYFDDDVMWDWIAICFVHHFTVIFNNAMPIIMAEDPVEILTVIATMMVGFILHHMYYSGSLTSEYINAMKTQHSLKEKLDNIEIFMKQMKFPETLGSDILTYYKTLWNQRKAIIDLPLITKVFPSKLKNEILTDIYWEAMMHSHICTLFGDAIKREMSTYMKTETYSSGQYLFRKNQLKHKMFYVSAGIIEVMSSESETLPILFLSSGTIIGEFSCVRPTISVESVRCSTASTLQSITYVDMCKLLRDNREVFKQLRAAIDTRIQFAKEKIGALKSSHIKSSHIHWIKFQWRRIAKKRSQDDRPMGKLPVQLSRAQNAYTSRFLDLLVLSSKDELKVFTFCIRGRCPFVLEENSPFRMLLEYIFLATTALQILFNFYFIAFVGKFSSEMFPFVSMLDFLYILDLYIQSITATTVQNILITKPFEVLIYRCKQVTFLIDVAASVPYDYLAKFFGYNDQYVILFRATKILKIYKIVLFFVKREVSLEYNMTMMKYFKYLTLNVFTVCLFSSIVFMTNCFLGTCLEHGWLMTSRDLKERVYHVKNHVDDSLEAWYYTVTTYFTFKLNTEAPSNVIDLIVIFLITSVGFYLTSMAAAQTYASSALAKKRKHMFCLSMETIEEFIKERRHLKPLRTQILNYKKLHWQISNNVSFKDISTINGIHCRYLKNRLQFGYIQQILRSTQLFQGCDEVFLKLVSNITDLFVIPSGSTLTLPNRRCVHLYIMVQGYCEVRSIVPGDIDRNTIRYYGEKSVFPVIEFFNQIDCFIHAKTVTEVQILTISFMNFHQLLKTNPAEQHMFKRCIAYHRAQFHNIITRTEIEYLTKPKGSNNKSVETFEYSTYREVMFDSSGLQLNKVSSNYRQLLHMILVRTYDPTGNFFLIYEMIRCVLIFINLILLCFFFSHTVSTMDYLMAMLDLLIVFDIYIKAHLQYYNANGIKVIHPLWTLKNYIHTSFFVDLISMFPYNVGLNRLFYKENNLEAYYLFLLIFRPLQLYRPYFLMSYLRHEKFYNHAALVRRLAWIVITFAIMGCLSCWAFVSVCTIANDYTITCKEFSWLVIQKKYGDQAQRSELYICFYLIIGFNTIRGMKAFTASGYISLVILALIVYRLKLFYTSKIMGANIFGNTSLSRYQDSVKNYLKFVASRNISNDKKVLFLQHYQFVWKQSKFQLPSNLFKNYFPFLKEQIYSMLYEKTLRKTEMFAYANHSLIYILVPYLTERYFAKDAHIMRCNDVVDEIFIIYKGFVEVYIAGHKMDVLGEGSVFGNFDNKGYTRQTIDVLATVHVTLLCMKTSDFYKTLEFYPLLRTEINLTRYLQIQYIPSVTSSAHNHINLPQPMASSISQKIRLSFLIDPNNIFYKIYSYITNVHIATLSSIVTMYLIVENNSHTFQSIYISLDVYFLIYTLLHCQVMHINPDSGIVVSEKRKLILLYVKSARFYIDIITLPPLYLLYRLEEKNSEHAGYYLVNKLFRILNLYEYYHSYALLKNIPRHLRWIFVIYMTMFAIQIMFNIWWCCLEAGTIAKLDSPILEAYMHVCNILTATAISEIGPTHHGEFTANIVLVLASHWIFQYLTEAFFTMILAQNNNSMKFRGEGDLLKIYCEKQAVSRMLVRQSWEYLIYVYNECKCEQMPRLLVDAPGQLKEAHLIALCGQIFENKPLFKNVHIDFLRQMITCVDFCTYLPGATVVEAGDRNGRMYFIEQGTVLRIDNDTAIEILREGQSFGELQGIRLISYKMTYKAMTICKIISVERNDWFYLLDWFPATKEIIFENIQLYY